MASTVNTGNQGKTIQNPLDWFFPNRNLSGSNANGAQAKNNDNNEDQPGVNAVGEAVRDTANDAKETIEHAREELKKQDATDMPGAPEQITPAQLPHESTAQESITNESAESEPIAHEQAGQKPIINESAESEPIAHEQAGQKPITNESVDPEPIAHEQAGQNPITNESAEPEPIAHEQVGQEPVKPAAPEQQAGTPADPAVDPKPVPELGNINKLWDVDHIDIGFFHINLKPLKDALAPGAHGVPFENIWKMASSMMDLHLNNQDNADAGTETPPEVASPGINYLNANPSVRPEYLRPQMQSSTANNLL